jgi:hypothetical protein
MSGQLAWYPFRIGGCRARSAPLVPLRLVAQRSHNDCHCYRWWCYLRRVRLGPLAWVGLHYYQRVFQQGAQYPRASGNFCVHTIAVSVVVHRVAWLTRSRFAACELRQPLQAAFARTPMWTFFSWVGHKFARSILPAVPLLAISRGDPSAITRSQRLGTGACPMYRHVACPRRGGTSGFRMVDTDDHVAVA